MDIMTSELLFSLTLLLLFIVLKLLLWFDHD